MKKLLIKFSGRYQSFKHTRNLAVLLFVIVALISGVIFISNSKPDYLRSIEVESLWRIRPAINFSNFEALFSREFHNNQILILFTLRDCPLCLHEAPYWGLTAKMFPQDLMMIGITDASDGEELKDFVQEYGLDFPIYTDQELFKKTLNFLTARNISPSTPIKLFISGKKLIAFETATKESQLQSNFPDRVRYIFSLE